MLKLADKAKLISKERLAELKHQVSKNHYIPDSNPGSQSYVKKDMLELIDYIELLERELKRLKKSI